MKCIINDLFMGVCNKINHLGYAAFPVRKLDVTPPKAHQPIQHSLKMLEIISITVRVTNSVLPQPEGL